MNYLNIIIELQNSKRPEAINSRPQNSNSTNEHMERGNSTNNRSTNSIRISNFKLLPNLFGFFRQPSVRRRCDPKSVNQTVAYYY